MNIDPKAFTGVVLSRDVYTDRSGFTTRKSLVPGWRLGSTGEMPGPMSVEHPFFLNVTGGYEDAIRAAARMASGTWVSTGGYWGTQPIAVVHASDGAYALTPLMRPPFGVGVVFAPAKQLAANGATQRWTREHVALEAIVAPDRVVDMRSVRVGSGETAPE